jgi:hypothetical protein
MWNHFFLESSSYSYYLCHYFLELMVYALNDIVGPRIHGNEPFDIHCFYGNNISLIEQQVQFLVAYTEDYDLHDLFKTYLYKMTRSTVIAKKNKMVNSHLVINCFRNSCSSSSETS